MIGYYGLLNESAAKVVISGESSIIKKLLNLPVKYFKEKK